MKAWVRPHLLLQGHHSVTRGGGGEAGVFVTDKLFISTFKILLHVYIEHFVLEVNYLFYARNLKKKKLQSPRPEIEWWPP